MKCGVLVAACGGCRWLLGLSGGCFEWGSHAWQVRLPPVLCGTQYAPCVGGDALSRNSGLILPVSAA